MDGFRHSVIISSTWRSPTSAWRLLSSTIGPKSTVRSILSIPDLVTLNSLLRALALWRKCGNFGLSGGTCRKACIFCIEITSRTAVFDRPTVHFRLTTDLQFLTCLVLYCRYDKVWKLTDYSLNRRSPAFDNWAGPLEDYGYDDPFRRGNFPPNMDIWSLGCVIYELVTLRKAFPNYSAFADVGSSLSALRTSAAASSNFLQDHMADSIFDLIQVDPNKRPPISLVDRIFGSYCEMLEIPGARILCDAPCYPRYQDWKAAIEIQLDSEGGKIFDKSMLYRLGDLLVENDQYHEACLVYKMTEQCR